MRQLLILFSFSSFLPPPLNKGLACMFWYYIQCILWKAAGRALLGRGSSLDHQNDVRCP